MFRSRHNLHSRHSRRTAKMPHGSRRAMAPHSPPHTLNPPPEATASSNRNTASPPAHTLSLSAGQPQYGQPAQPAAGYGQQPGYGQAYQQPNAYAQPQYTAAPYAAAPVGQSSKSKLAAGLLGIFLGGLGVHNFYLGNTGKAVAQLLLTLVGWILLGLGPIAAAIWGFVEGIIILCSKPGSPWHKDANGYELSD